jgi:hypothetical protein
MRVVACLRMDFDMEIQLSQLKINHLSNTPSTKAAGGGIFSGVFTQGSPGTTQGQEDFELSWYLFFQQRYIPIALPQIIIGALVIIVPLVCALLRCHHRCQRRLRRRFPSPLP